MSFCAWGRRIDVGNSWNIWAFPGLRASDCHQGDRCLSLTVSILSIIGIMIIMNIVVTHSTCATPHRYFTIYTFIWYLQGFFRVSLGFIWASFRGFPKVLVGLLKGLCKRGRNHSERKSADSLQILHKWRVPGSHVMDSQIIPWWEATKYCKGYQKWGPRQSSQKTDVGAQHPQVLAIFVTAALYIYIYCSYIYI